VASFSTDNQPAGYFIPDQPIIITRMTVAVGSGQNSLCNLLDEYIALYEGNSFLTEVDVANQGTLTQVPSNTSFPLGLNYS